MGTPRTHAELAAVRNAYDIPESFNPLLERMTFVYANLNRIYTGGIEVDGEAPINRVSARARRMDIFETPATRSAEPG